MPQTITDPSDPNWGLPASVSAPGTAPAARGSVITDPTDPNWGLERPPDFRVENEPPSPTLWQQANTPLIPQIHAAGKAIADWLDRPGMTVGTPERGHYKWGEEFTTKLNAQLRGAVAGGVEGAADLLASFTSPVGLALSLAGVGPESKVVEAVPALKPVLSLPAVRALQRTVQAGAGGAFAVHGAGQVVSAPTWGEKAQGAVELASGALGLTAATPTVRSSQYRLNPAEAAAVQFGREQGIPLDVATQTGSQFARAAQKRVAHSIGGEGTAERMVRAQQQALARVGGELTEQAAPGTGYVSPEQAGTGVQTSTRQLIRDLHTQATDAYDRLRAFEADPRFASRVQTAPAGSKAFQRIQNKLAAGLESGQTPSVAELTVMRQLEQELDAMPFSQRRLQPSRYGGSLEPVEGTGGAGTPVYNEILQAAPGTADMTRGDVQAGIRKTLETGDWNNASRGAFEVARQRLRNSGSVTGPSLPANMPILGTAESVPLAINLTQTKSALQPIYDRLLREAQLAPLMGGKAQALRALDRLMSGPDVAALSTVDAALGDLKTIARTDLPELRTEGQSIAAQAVKQLDAQVKARAAKAGPDVLAALEEGRAATVGKYQAAGVLESMRSEPVQAYRQLVAPKDSAIQHLRRVQEMAPAEIPKIGRAYLEDLLSMATAEGGFDRAARLQAEWQKLGPETKRILFPDLAHRAQLDHFFLLAKRLSDNPNPSGTAVVNNVFNWTAGLGGYPLSKLLYTNPGARAMSQVLAVGLKPYTSGAARTAAMLNLAAAAKRVGVELPALVQAADRDTSGPAIAQRQ